MHHSVTERLHKEMNVDLWAQILVYSKSSLFFCSEFPFFLLSINWSFLPPSVPSAGSPDPLLFWLSVFNSGDRMAYSSFQDTDILSCLFSSLHSCFPIQVTFPAGKPGPHKSFWQPQTDLVENHPFLGRQSRRATLCVRAVIHTPSLRLDSSPKSLPTQLHIPWDGDILFQLNGCMLPWKWNAEGLESTKLSFVHILCQKLGMDFSVFKTL